MPIVSRGRVLVGAGAILLALAVLAVLEWDAGQVLLAVLGVVALMVAGIVWRPERRIPWLCDPLVLFIAFQAQFFVVGPIAHSLAGYWVLAPFPPSRVVFSVGLFALLLIGFYLGYGNRTGATLGRALPTFSRHAQRMPGNMYETLLVTASLAGCWGYVTARGGIEAIVRSRYGTHSGLAMYLIAFHALLAVTIVIAYRLFDAPRYRPGRLAVLLGLLGFEAVVWGLFVGARKLLFYLFFGILSVYLLRRGLHRLPKLRVGALMACLLVFFSVWGTVRSRPLLELAQGGEEPGAQTVPGYLGYVRSVTEPFEIVALCPDIFPEVEPYRWGGTVLVTLVGVIPRSVWPDKPVGLGKDLTRYTAGVHYDPTGAHSVTPTLVGDFYANFGPLGPLFGGVLFGLACRVVAAYAAEGMRNRVQTTAARVLLPAVFNAGLVEIRASMAMILAFYILTLVPLFLGLILSRIGVSQEASRPPAAVPARA